MLQTSPLPSLWKVRQVSKHSQMKGVTDHVKKDEAKSNCKLNKMVQNENVQEKSTSPHESVNRRPLLLRRGRPPGKGTAAKWLHKGTCSGSYCGDLKHDSGTERQMKQQQR